MRCSTEESRCYCYTLYVQRRSQDAIVVHEMFNGRVEMLSLYMRCLTEESRCYRYTLDVQLMSRDAISAHEMFNGGVESADAAGVVAGHVQNEGILNIKRANLHTLSDALQLKFNLDDVFRAPFLTDNCSLDFWSLANSNAIATIAGEGSSSYANISKASLKEDEANEKIQNAYCLPGIVEGNPCLEYIKYIVFPWFNKFKVERKEENGGATEKAFANYDELVAAYEEGDLHPDDLKHALSKALNEIFQDVHLTPFHYGSAAVAAGRLADVAVGRLSLQWVDIWDDSRRLKPLEIDQVALMMLNEFYRLIVDTMASQ
ncbi:tyrosine--tRNA ligase 1, cytoplasmic-like protein isoform X1 [Tanacetum coccineum]